MKQVIFILLVFISFQGFSQSVKINYCDSLEVMKTDLGIMTWDEAKKACEKLGDGWRLPTKDELIKLYKYKERIGGFKDDFYWSSAEYKEYAHALSFLKGTTYSTIKTNTFYVRAVRDLE